MENNNLQAAELMKSRRGSRGELGKLVKCVETGEVLTRKEWASVISKVNGCGAQTAYVYICRAVRHRMPYLGLTFEVVA